MADDAASGPRRAVPLGRVRAARGEARVAVPRNKVAGTRAFRRVRADRTFGVIGVLLVVFALVLVFRWERPIPPEPSYGIDWVETETNLTALVAPNASTCRESREAEHPGFNCTILAQAHKRPTTLDLTFEVPQANVSSMMLRVAWRDDVGNEPDEFDALDFNLTGPPSTSKHVRIGTQLAPHDRWVLAQAQTGVVDLPTVRSVPAASEAAARELLGDRYLNRNGTGTWKLTVRLEDARDDWAPNTERLQGERDGECPANSPPTICTPDNGQWFIVQITYKHYHAAFRAPRAA